MVICRLVQKKSGNQVDKATEDDKVSEPVSNKSGFRDIFKVRIVLWLNYRR